MAVKILYLVLLLKFYATTSINCKLNNRPIIGIPTMAITDELLLQKKPHLKGKSYIAASYVKYIEMAGARVVPILSDSADDKELEKIFNSVNGLLFTGGEVNLEYSSYYNTTKKLFKLARNANSKNDHFPILGICRGMQAMLVHSVGDLSILKLTDAKNYTTSLRWISTDGELVRNIPDKLLTTVSSKNITSHFHKYGITPKDFKRNSTLKDMYDIVATSFDRNGKEFISIYEGKEEPFYGLQFHPEKTVFEWADTVTIPHTRETVRFAQQLVDNFMDQVRKNKHSFDSRAEERQHVISRRQTLYTGNLTESHSPFVEIFVF